MKTGLLALLSATFLGSSLLVGVGTYSLLNASTTNASNGLSTFQAQTIDIQNAPVGAAESPIQVYSIVGVSAHFGRVQFPMFYDSVPYPTGQNPYDVSKGTPSGESPGGWAPGDSVTRYWPVNNKGTSAKFTGISAKLVSLTGAGGTISPGTPTYSDFLNYMNVTVYSPEDDYTVPVFTGSFQRLVSGNQPLDRMMFLATGCRDFSPKFVVEMDLNAGNDLQGVRGIVDFRLLAEQVSGNCFDPPFSNTDYSMQIGSTTPIKFERYDSHGDLLRDADPNVSLVITGPKAGGGTLRLMYSIGHGLSAAGGHYQANVTKIQTGYFIDGGDYTATVYDGSREVCDKSFSAQPGNRSNAP